MARHVVDVGGHTATKQHAEAHKSSDKARGHHKEIWHFTQSCKRKNSTRGSRKTVTGILTHKISDI